MQIQTTLASPSDFAFAQLDAEQFCSESISYGIRAAIMRFRRRVPVSHVPVD
jgi:hypothetical protein